MANTTSHHTVGVHMERKLYERVLSDARADRRTVSNLINVIVEAYYKGKAEPKLNGHHAPKAVRAAP